MKTQHIMILGSSGRLGAELIIAFENSGAKVTTQSIRNWTPSKLKTLPSKDIDVVINAANPIYTKWASQATNSCQASIQIAKHYGAALLFPGNVYNYGKAMPPRLETNTPQLAKTKKGLIRIAQEEMMRGAAKEGVPTIIIRAGDFFGAGKGAWFDLAIAKSIHKNQVCYPGGLDHRHAWAYLPDLAAYFVQVAHVRKTLAPFAQIHFEGFTLTGNQLISAIAIASGKAPTQKKFPWWLFKSLQFFIPSWREVLEIAYLWNVPHQLVNSTGPVPLQTTPLPQAMKNAIAALKAN
jgi:nucleoside-diphosphate-sugar epimerase